MLLAPLLFFELLPLCDFAMTGELLNPIKRIRDMLTLSGSIKFTNSPYHPSALRPWEWLLPLKSMPYNWKPDYTAVISPTLWALIIPSIVYASWQIKKGGKAALFSVIWFASTYLVWIPIELMTDRITYVFYFFPTIGSICIGLGIGFSRLLELWQKKERRVLRVLVPSLVVLFLLAHLGVFVSFSPVFARWLPSLNIAPPLTTLHSSTSLTSAP